MKIRFILLVLLSLLGIGLFRAGLRVEAVNIQTKQTPQPAQSVQIDQDILEEIEGAIFQEIASRRETLVYSAFATRLERITVSADEKFASAWMILTSPETGQDIPGEPGLALLTRVRDLWEVSLPGDGDWMEKLSRAPADVISPAEKDYWLEINAESVALLPQASISGYLLPWEGGKTAYLSGSVAHDAYIPSGNAHYAFDFYVPGSAASVKFDLYAARAGTVWLYRDTQPDHSEESPGNYLVLKDTTTFPTTYQLYLHLAQNSIPPELKVIGAPVQQGQFIGVADDTGFSTGNHLHFHVHTEPASYWGRSVDITFDDVTINGGRPRVKNQFYNDEAYCRTDDVCVSFQSAYVSGNKKTDPFPPTGGFLNIANDDIIRSKTLVISGWAEDKESGIRSIQIVAAYAGEIRPIGPLFNVSPFTYSWDMCQAGAPDGPISLGLRIFDKQSNQAYLTGLVTVTKSYHCATPPPACQASPSQVALFSESNFGGLCQLFGVGSYLALASSAIQDNHAASIQVGQNVQATLFADANLQGRAETFSQDDRNLGDNRIGANQASSLRVSLKSSPPSIPQPVFPNSGYVYDPKDSLTLYWNHLGEAEEFQARIVLGSETIESPWMRAVNWSLGTMLGAFAPGVYSWQVQSRNAQGVSGWSSPFSLVVLDPSEVSPPQAVLPFFDSVEGGIGAWTATGLWHREQDPSPIDDPDGSFYWWFGEQSNGDEYYFSAKSGSLTSPKFTLPVGQTYYLSFNYAYQTETKNPFWDQRWVQIRVGDGPFTSLYQLYDDVMTGPGAPVWHTSPWIDLSAYAGKQIQIRFFFDTVDASFAKPDNDFEGWYIDDIRIAAQPPPICNDVFEPNDELSRAATLSYLPKTEIEAQICPIGDVDYYRFYALAGGTIAFDVDAQEDGSALDAVVAVLDQDGSLLAENDDLDSGLFDPTLRFQAPRDGWYFLKIKPWDHPAGGDAHSYHLVVQQDDNPPTVRILNPDRIALGTQPIVIQAQASDLEGEIEQVKFFWHNHDWNDPAWIFLGNGQRSGSVWQVTFDPTGRPEGKRGAFYALAVDSGGNRSGDGAWDIVIDRSPPASELQPLAPVQSSTALMLTWTGQDAYSAIHHYDIQFRIDSEDWQDLAAGVTGSVTRLWYVGDPGRIYAFRIRAVDMAGNLEAYPSEERTTYIPSAADLCQAPDGFEVDNTYLQAISLGFEAPAQLHNFCNTSSPANFRDDQDWLRIATTQGRQFSVLAMPESNSAAYLSLALFSLSGGNLVELKQTQSSEFGHPALISYTPSENGIIYLRIRSVDGNVFGVGTGYRLYAYPGPPRVFWLPVIAR